jgi:hypothetical protein
MYIIQVKDSFKSDWKPAQDLEFRLFVFEKKVQAINHIQKWKEDWNKRPLTLRALKRFGIKYRIVRLG